MHGMSLRPVCLLLPKRRVPLLHTMCQMKAITVASSHNAGKTVSPRPRGKYMTTPFCLHCANVLEPSPSLVCTLTRKPAPSWAKKRVFPLSLSGEDGGNIDIRRRAEKGTQAEKRGRRKRTYFMFRAAFETLRCYGGIERGGSF